MRQTHKVTRFIKCLAEIDEFLQTTQNFGKKFYKVGLIHHEVKNKKQVWLSITAIGISRDLVYEIKWQPEAEPLPDTPDEADIHAGDAPIEGWIPTDPDILKRLYPNHGAVPDAPGEHHWFTLFAMHGFIIVDVIEEL